MAAWEMLLRDYESQWSLTFEVRKRARDFFGL